MDTEIGIDEVGRGSWAGPLLVVAARKIKPLPSGLNDSKRLTKNQRQALMPGIASTCQLGEGWVQPSEVDDLGLAAGMRLGVQRALEALRAKTNESIIMDGTVNYCPAKYTKVKCVVGADASYPLVSAASIFAKVSRDDFMAQVAAKFPEYGFEKHVGYGTKAHLEALKNLGVCSLHRRSYKPVQAFL